MSIAAPYEFPMVALRSTGSDQIDDLEALTVAGTTLYLPDDTYIVSREWHISVHNFWVIGAGSGTPTTHAGTTIKRTTTVGDAVVRWGGEDGLSYPLSDYPTFGGGMRGLALNANSAADHGLLVKSAAGARFENVLVTGAAVSGILLDTLTQNTGSIDQLNCTQSNRFEQVTVRATGSADGLVITGQYPDNSYANTFDGFQVGYATGVAIKIVNADDNWFQNYFTASSGTSQTAIELSGSSGAGRADNNFFIGGFPFSGTQKVIARGNSNARPSRGNVFIGYGNVDHRSQITIESGARVYFLNGDGRTTLTPDERSLVTERDDFMRSSITTGQVGSFGWDIIGGTVAPIVSETNHPGILRIDSGSVSGTVAGISLMQDAGVGLIRPGSNFEFVFIVRLNQLDSDTTCRVGLILPGQEDASQPTTGIYFEKLGSDTNWFGVCRANGTETRADTGFEVTTDFMKLLIRRRTNADIGFGVGNIVNGFETGDIFTNVTSSFLNPTVRVTTGASASKTLDVDLVQYSVTGMDR